MGGNKSDDLSSDAGNVLYKESASRRKIFGYGCWNMYKAQNQKCVVWRVQVSPMMESSSWDHFPHSYKLYVYLTPSHYCNFLEDFLVRVLQVSTTFPVSVHLVQLFRYTNIVSILQVVEIFCFGQRIGSIAIACGIVACGYLHRNLTLIPTQKFGER